MNQDKWDKRYLNMAALVSTWSKDPRAQVGAVIVKNNRVIATGFNGFPSEVLDNDDRLHDQQKKLDMVVHAEENAMIVAGRSAEGATIYVHGKPVCSRCAGSIIQSGIVRVVAMPPEKAGRSKWARSARLASCMFLEAGVQCHEKQLSEAELREDHREVEDHLNNRLVSGKDAPIAKLRNVSAAGPRAKSRRQKLSSK